MENRSTVTILTCITQYISNIIDRQMQVDVIYTDIQKAFDHVDHFLLLTKLDNVGFSSNLLFLMKSYLMRKRQFVEYAGFKSEEHLTRFISIHICERYPILSEVLCGFTYNIIIVLIPKVLL